MHIYINTHLFMLTIYFHCSKFINVEFKTKKTLYMLSTNAINNFQCSKFINVELKTKKHSMLSTNAINNFHCSKFINVEFKTA